MGGTQLTTRVWVIGSLVVGLVTTSCGGAATSPPSPTPPPAPIPTAARTSTLPPSPSQHPLIPVLIKAAEDSVATGSVNVEVVGEFRDSVIVPDGTTFSGRGVSTLGGPRRMRFELDLSAFGSGSLEMILDETSLHMRGDAVLALVGPDKWLFVDIESSNPAAAGFAALTTGRNDNSLALYYLFGATGLVQEPAPQEINGVVMRYLRFDVDLELAAQRTTGDTREVILDNVAELRVNGVDRTVLAEAWIGPDGLVYRLVYVYALGRQSGGGALGATYDFSLYGSPVDLALPDPSMVVNLDDLRPPG